MKSNMNVQKTLEKFLSNKKNLSISWQVCFRCKNNLPIDYKFFNYSPNKYKNNSKFTNICIFCSEDNYKNLSTENVLEVYHMFIKKDENFPPSFWSKHTIFIILRYLIINKYKMNISEIYDKVNISFFRKHRLKVDLFDTFLDAIYYSFPEYDFIPWKFTSVPKGFWNDDKNKITALRWLVEMLISDNIIQSLEELPNKIRQKQINEYGLGGLLNSTSGEYNIYELFNLAYPDKWNPVDFLFLKKGYKHGNKGDFKKFITDIITVKLKYDTREKLLNIAQKDFYDNGLNGLLAIFYDHSATKCIIECFPEYELMQWEFNKVKNGYWQEEENRINALRELIEIKLKLNLDEIPNVISYNYLESNFYKFRIIVDKYYNSNIFEWVNTVYPNKFSAENFYNFICTDGTKVLSNKEVLIHNYLNENYKHVNVEYVGKNKNNKIYNYIDNENYIPDWIFNENIIVEYFGYYDEKRMSNKRVINYVEKTHRKINFYEQYCTDNPEYTFVALYPSDLKKSMNGLREKLLHLQVS